MNLQFLQMIQDTFLSSFYKCNLKMNQLYTIMLAFGDVEIEKLLGAGGLKLPDNNCTSGHKVERLCCKGSCTLEAACCNNDDCKYCQGRHSACPFIDLKRLIKRDEGGLFFARKAVGDILKVQNHLLNQLSAIRKILIEKIKGRIDNGSHSSGVGYFFVKGDPTKLKGKQVRDFLEGLADKAKQTQVEECLQQFRKEGGELVGSLIDRREKVVSQLMSYQDHSKIYSKILLQDKEGWGKAQYLLKQLGNPSKLKLLFRASQHSFSAAKFHQFCDNIPNTVTIVRTEFSRTIAAYTPLKWQATENQTQVADPSLSSFLLQLELREKMSLIKGQESTAIQNYKNWGPVFGFGDLAIADNCNQNKNSGGGFPISYNCGGKYSERRPIKNPLSLPLYSSLLIFL